MISDKELSVLDKNKPLTLVSDFWGYLDFRIKSAYSGVTSRINCNKASDIGEGSLSDIALANYSTAMSWSNQARSFHISARESTSWVSQPLLYYYSFLNYVKVLGYLNNKDSVNEDGVSILREYHHGIDEKSGGLRSLMSDSLTFKSVTSPRESVFKILTNVVDPYSVNLFDPTNSILIENIIKSCPILSKSVKAINNKDVSYFPSNKGMRSDIVRLAESLYLVKKEYPLVGVFALSLVYSSEGTRAYIATNSSAINQLLAIYLFMFYLGSISRYRPYLLENKEREAAEQWVIKEFLELAPYQFYYQTLSLDLGEGIQYPKASVIF